MKSGSKKQFSLDREALSTYGHQKSNFLSVPIALTWSILRVPLHYFVAAAAFETVLLLNWFAAGTLPTLVPVPFLPDLISSFLNLYLISVGMRILGLLYLSNRDEFGWFSRLGH